jgi:hypothetical protein
MKLIIAGSRDIVISKDISTSLEYLESIIRKYYPFIIDFEIISGMSGNIDLLAVKLAEKNKYNIKKFPANWNKYGKEAGPIRNKEMAEYADSAIVIMKKEGSPGSRNMIMNMKKLNKPCFVISV